MSDYANPKFLHEFVGHQQSIKSVALIHSDQRLFIYLTYELTSNFRFLSGSLDYNIFFYDIRTQRREASWNFEGSVNVIAVSPDQSLVVAGGSHYDIKGNQSSSVRSKIHFAL